MPKKCKGGVCRQPARPVAPAPAPAALVANPAPMAVTRQALRQQKKDVKLQNKQNRVAQKQIAVQNEAARNAALASGEPQYADSPIYTIPPKKGFWKGQRPHIENIPIRTKAEAQYLDTALQKATDMLSNPEATAAYSGAQNFFRDVVTPTLSNRWGVLGSGQHQRASGMQAALSGAGKQLSLQLPALIQSLALDLGQTGLQPRYAQRQNPGSPGAWHAIASMFGPAGRHLLNAGLGYDVNTPESNAAGSQLNALLAAALGAAGAGIGGAAGSALSGAGNVLGMLGGGGGGYGIPGSTLGTLLGGAPRQQASASGYGYGGGSNSLLDDEAIQQLIAAIVGNEDIKQTLMRGG